MTTHLPPGGPYCNDDMTTWYVAAEDCGYLEARRLVRDTAEVDGWQRLKYRRREMVYLWDGDEHDHEVEGRCASEDCRYVMAWTFDVEER